MSETRFLYQLANSFGAKAAQLVQVAASDQTVPPSPRRDESHRYQTAPDKSGFYETPFMGCNLVVRRFIAVANAGGQNSRVM